jgi:tRNA dimethylallyltransferase
MFKRGLVEETSALRKQFGDNTPPLSSLGYKQALQLLNAAVDEPAAIAAAQQGHRNYAKRQMTWFRREQDVLWIKGFGDERSVQLQASEIVVARVQSDKTND